MTGTLPRPRRADGRGNSSPPLFRTGATARSHSSVRWLEVAIAFSCVSINPLRRRYARPWRAHTRARPPSSCAPCRWGDGIREQLTRASFEKKLPFLLLDQLLLAFLAPQASPHLASFFALSLPFSYCKAFQTRSSFVPPEMFFGRERERSEVSDFDDGSCFLYGGRQLGKTALLRRVQEDFTSPKHGRFAVWIDLKDGGIGDADTADIWAVIWKHLRELKAIDETVRMPTRDSRSVEAFCEALHARFNPKTRGKLLILLDEADNFLRRDALNSSRATFAESSRLKALMERHRSIKVVFAGLHNVLRTTNQSNHPLAHMGTPICIGPFIQPEERLQAEDLLSVPLQACGYGSTRGG